MVRRSEYDQHDVLRQIHNPSDSEPEDVILVVDVWITSKYVSSVPWRAETSREARFCAVQN